MNEPGFIVVGVDGSPSTVDALGWAVDQAVLTGAGVHAVIAWEYPVLSGVDPMTTQVDWRAKAQQTIDAVLVKAGGTDSVDVSSMVIAGNAARVLLDASAGADLLVVGNRGHGALTEVLPDSVREHVITHASCPVLVMCHPTQAPSGSSE